MTKSETQKYVKELKEEIDSLELEKKILKAQRDAMEKAYCGIREEIGKQKSEIAELKAAIVRLALKQ